MELDFGRSIRASTTIAFALSRIFIGALSEARARVPYARQNMWMELGRAYVVSFEQETSLRCVISMRLIVTYYLIHIYTVRFTGENDIIIRREMKK